MLKMDIKTQKKNYNCYGAMLRVHSKTHSQYKDFFILATGWD